MCGASSACLSVALVASIVVAAARTGAQAAPFRFAIRAENQIPIDRPVETVAIAWASVQARLPSAQPNAVHVIDSEDREIATQVVDNDGDGKPDELLFQAAFAPGQTRTFTVNAGAPQTKFESRVYVRHDEPRDDVAWESDRIAFRIYGEGLKKTSSAMSSSGIDVWNKRTRALIVEKWYTKGHDAYHVDTGEGADFYDVGETLGNGGTAIWRNDTIYCSDNFKAYRIIANGPIRAIFELRYDPWNAAGLSVSETKRIAIDAGQNMYREESVFTSPGAADIPYVIGEVKRAGMRGTESKAQPWAWLTGWGPVDPKNGGHGELGTAVMLPRDRVTDWKEADNHYLALSRAKSGQPVVHYIGAGWTASGDFPTPQSWWAYLDSFAQRLASPIRVSEPDFAR